MKLGLAIFPTTETIPPDELGRLVEAAGMDSLWLPEHSHTPVRRESRYPMGGELPPYYGRSLDPFVALAAVAAATERLLLGFGVVLIIQRDPIETAKAAATLDLISRGRVLFGVGAGWNLEEMRNHGTDPARRFRLMRERVEAMRAIWTEPEPEYHGELVDFDPIWCEPKPLQQPLPVYVGGGGPRVLDRVVRYGDGWLPNAQSPEVMAERIAELDRLAREAGRGPLPTTIYGARPEREGVARYAEIGVERVVFFLPSGPREATERELERCAALL
jgi:probable F420-dependent oxidoreductase